MRMNSTLLSTSRRSRRWKSLTAELPARPPELLGELQVRLQLEDALLGRQLQVLAEQPDVHMLPVGVDHRIRRDAPAGQRTLDFFGVVISVHRLPPALPNHCTRIRPGTS